MSNSVTPSLYLKKKGRLETWRQDTPVMQAVSLLQSIEMDAEGIVRGYTSDPKGTAARITDQAQQMRELLAYLVGDSW